MVEDHRQARDFGSRGEQRTIPGEKGREASVDAPHTKMISPIRILDRRSSGDWGVAARPT